MERRLILAIVLVSLLFFGNLSYVPITAPARAAPPRSTVDVPFFSQTALRSQPVSSDRAYTLGNSDLPLSEYGCGVASLAMAYARHGVDTDLVRLNASLRQAGGFAGALLDWSDVPALVQAGAPWIRGVERINTGRPQDYAERIDRALAAGEPVIAYLNSEHYVVLTGKDEGQAEADAAYRINDPWALSEAEGKDIALADNVLGKGGFDRIRQLVFVSRQEYAPTNSIPVEGAIRDRYIAHNGAAGSLGNPVATAEELPDGHGQWQRFQHGAIFAPDGQPAVLLAGPVWQKYQALGGAGKLGAPVADMAPYFVGPAAEWRADLVDGAILWQEGDAQATWIDAASGVRAEYFANPDLRGAPTYSRVERDILFDWGAGSPGPWAPADDFSARFTQTLTAGFLGRWLNFAVDADDHVRVRIDGVTLLDTWDGGQGGKFTKYLGRGEHELVVEYRERSGDAHLLVGSAVWPATPVFAAEEAAGSFEQLPASAADYVTESPQQAAQATPTPRAATPTPTPPAEQAVAEAAGRSFQAWAAANGEPYRDEAVAVLENDGFFATVQVTAWFRPSREAAWEERQAQAECRLVGDAWQCDAAFAFGLSQGEQARRAQATATAVASQPPVWTEPATGMAFLRVPAGEFTMGSTEEEIDDALALCQQFDDDCERAWFEGEAPQHQLYLDEYWIGQTEVTNAQYRLFVDAGGYDEPAYWTDAGWQLRQDRDLTEPACWDDADLNQPDQPVVCVTWYEAVAYTRWLAAITGEEFRLPSEAEWAKAARGIDGRIFPWGDEWDGTRLNYCDVNCPDDGWKDEAVDDGYAYSAPVGSYPDGASPYGALDMAGNVWEWTSTAWGGCDWPGPGTFRYPYVADDGREELEGSDCRVLRGGSWYFHPAWTRAGFRWGPPDDRVDHRGLRVVVAVSPGF